MIYRSPASTGVLRPLVVAGFVLLAYAAGQQIVEGTGLTLALLIAAAVSVFVLLSPRLGLYVFLVAAIMVPYDWRISKVSVSSLAVGAALTAWAVGLAIRRAPWKPSPLYGWAGVAAAVSWVNFVRYGPVSGCAVCGFNVPYVLTEALVLFLLSYHLIQSRRHLYALLAVLAGALVLRNLIDVVFTLQSIAAGNLLGAIRSEQLWLRVDSTAESEWRSLVLPVLLTATVFLRRGMLRILMPLALFLTAAWLALAATRIGFLGLVLSGVVVLMLLPSAQRKPLLLWAPPVAILVAFLAGVFSQSWSHILSKNPFDRVEIWRGAFRAFLQSPIWGSSVGASHSYFLGAARYMGLLFLLPLAVALWLIWRRAAWLRNNVSDPLSLALVYGIQGSLLVAVVLNFLSTTFQGAVAAFFFWVLVGAHEALYLDVEARRFMIALPPEEGVPEARRGVSRALSAVPDDPRRRRRPQGSQGAR